MKCFVLLLAFLAICHSYPSGTGYGYASRNINISEDGTIVISAAGGKKIIITKGVGPKGQRTVDISVSGPNIPTKKIQVNDQNELFRSIGESEYDTGDEYSRDKRSSKDTKKQKSQGETLSQILGGYKGDVDQTAYQQLLKEIKTAVQEGQVSPSVYEALLGLNSNQVPGSIWARQQGTAGVQRQGDILDLLLEQQLQQQQYPQNVRIPNQQITDSLWYSEPQVGQYVRNSGFLPWSRPLGVGRSVYGTADSFGVSAYGQQAGPIDQSIAARFDEVINEERQVLDQQRQIQQQQLQLQQQQQLLQQQLLQQQQQGPLWDQQYQQQGPSNWRDYLLNGVGSYLQTRGQQSLWQQQPAVYPQEGFYGGYGQRFPIFQQRYNAPFVL